MTSEIFLPKPRFYTQLLFLEAIFSWPWLTAHYARLKKIDTPKRILIIPQLQRIGDIIAVTPALRAIKKQYPTAHLAVLVSAKTRDILKHNPDINEHLLYQSAGGRGLFKKIRSGNYDTGISFSGTPRSILLLYLGLVPNRIKLVRKKRTLTERATDWLATKQFVFPNHVSLVGFFLGMLSQIGIQSTDKQKIVVAPAESVTKAHEFITTHSLNDGKPIIGLSVTAGNKVKEWPTERFGFLIEKIAAVHDVHFVITSGPADQHYKEKLLHITSRVIFADTFTLSELPALMQHFSLYICANTGPMHIADALQVPIVLINGAVDDKEMIPETAAFEIAYPTPKEAATAISAFGTNDDQRSEHAMQNTSVENVLEKCETLFARVKK